MNGNDDRKELQELKDKATQAIGESHSKSSLLLALSKLVADSLPKPEALVPCHAVIHHGPGHQSTTHCRLTGKHNMHEAYYGSHEQFARWKGKQVFSGCFDEPPDDPKEDK